MADMSNKKDRIAEHQDPCNLLFSVKVFAEGFALFDKILKYFQLFYL